MKACHRCKAPWDQGGQPGFNNTCAQCGMPLHACINCTSYISSGALRCMQPDAARIHDPYAGNRCALFEFGRHQGRPREQDASEGRSAGRAYDPGAARRAWDELFGDPPT